MVKASSSLSFPKSSRVLKNSDFAVIQKRAKRVYSRNFSALIATGPLRRQSKSDIQKIEDRPARLGITVSKKTEKLAVRRNRIKRIIREAFRQIKQHCPDNLCLVIVAKSSCANLSSTEFREELATLLKTQKILSANVF